jgi:hypothetical protein
MASANDLVCPKCGKTLDWKHLWYKGLVCDICDLDYKKLIPSSNKLNDFTTYFFKHDDKIVYVGCTTDLKKRLSSHEKLKFYSKRQGFKISIHLSMILGETLMFQIFKPEWNSNKPDHTYSNGIRFKRDGRYEYVNKPTHETLAQDLMGYNIKSSCDHAVCDSFETTLYSKVAGILYVNDKMDHNLVEKFSEKHDCRSWCYCNPKIRCECHYPCMIRLRHMLMLGRKTEFKEEKKQQGR